MLLYISKIRDGGGVGKYMLLYISKIRDGGQPCLGWSREIHAALYKQDKRRWPALLGME